MNFYIQIEITIEFKYLVSVKQSIWGKQEQIKPPGNTPLGEKILMNPAKAKRKERQKARKHSRNRKENS